MMLAASPATYGKSSLEAMLEQLRWRDECEVPKDLPPALPARPASRGRRLPSNRRSVLTELKAHGDGGNCVKSGVNEEEAIKDAKPKVEMGHKWNSFGSKKIRKDQKADSPYNPELEFSDREKSGKMAAGEDGISPEIEGKESDWDVRQNVDYFIKKKLHVWCKVPNGQWESGTIQSTSGEESSVSLSNGTMVEVLTADLLPANPECLSGVDDLIQLSFLNDPSVLHNLQNRYTNDMIYSKAGPLLIAINPLKDVQIYGNDFVTAYQQKTLDSPHVYAVADAAYSAMMRGAVNQSIIISGESGAGKTETAKYIVQYLAALGDRLEGIDCGILCANCVLEAFGNAKTCRNKNASRFGKLVEVHFSSAGKISSATVQTFLMEKSRVVQLSEDERSYHIFYELCAGASPTLREKLNLKYASEYNYLNQGGCMFIDGVDDAEKFHKLTEALDVIQICKEDQEHVFSMLAAVLWLGNISFRVIDNENHVEALETEALINAATLIGCDVQTLALALSIHRIEAGKDIIIKKKTLQQALDSRDALAKFIYASLFEWLVEEINKYLRLGKQLTQNSISILDIYGFESFKKNNFEQFCINYANERLQQHFNRHLLKLEQEEYELDGVDWAKVVFEDNQECLDLFEKVSSRTKVGLYGTSVCKKPVGLLSLLDEESNFPKATDLTFANKLKQHLKSNTCFKAQRGRAFGIQHYAGEVVYDTNGFLEKNRDTLHLELGQLLSSCSHKLVQLFSSKMLDQKVKPTTPVDGKKLSVGTKFKGHLFKLMNQLESTKPHFIRCIKPNSRQLHGIFEQEFVLHQLRCCGILEVVRISRSGYPTRMTHQEFAERYGFLLLETKVVKDPLNISVGVLQKFNIHPEMYQVGYTKLHLRTGLIGALEDRRNQVMAGIIETQKLFRAKRARRIFYELKNGAILVQSVARGENIRKYANEARQYEVPASQMFNAQLTAIILLQSVIRGWLARRQLHSMLSCQKLNHEIVKAKRKPRRKSSELKDLCREQQLPVLPSVLQELQKRVQKAESTLDQKEQENASLREQLQQLQAKSACYEENLKSMEEKSQKHVRSAQSSVYAAKRTVTPGCTHGQSETVDPSPSFSRFLSGDRMSLGSQANVRSTQVNAYGAVPIGRGREINGSVNAVSNLVNEFEQQTQIFVESAKLLVNDKTVKPISDPDVELRKLRKNFESWKKDFKMRIKDAKAKVRKMGKSDVKKSRRSWLAWIGL